MIHTYAYQQYNADGRRYANDLKFIRDQAFNDISANGLSGTVKFGLTEFNVHSNGTFDTRTDDLNTPSRYARLGGIFTGLINQQADELYVFKFSSNAQDSFLQKNAVFTNSRFDAPYNVGGATAAAGVLKLFTKGFAGSQSLLDEPSHSINDLDVAASHNESEGRYYLLSANERTASRNLTFDLSALNIETGAIVQIEEVSTGSIAEVTQRLPLPSNGQIAFQQSAESVALISVSEAAGNLVALQPTDDATVRAGTGGSNAGSSNNIFVRNIVNDTNLSNGRAVGLLQFDISSIGNDLVDRAVIQVNGDVDEGNADFVTTHVFGIRGDDWDQDTVTWNDVNNLLNTSQQGTRALIADNFVTGISDTAEFLGHLTFGQNTKLVSLDITDYLKSNLDDDLRLLIAREVRVDGEAADRSDGAVRLDSSEDLDGIGPQLLLELTAVTAPILLGDVNLDGFVNFLDIAPFIGRLTSGEFQRQADVNEDGFVSFLDIAPFIEILSGQ